MNSSVSIGHSRRGSCPVPVPVPVVEDGGKRSKFVDERSQSVLLFCAADWWVDCAGLVRLLLLLLWKFDQSVVWVVVWKAGIVRYPWEVGWVLLSRDLC